MKPAHHKKIKSHLAKAAHHSAKAHELMEMHHEAKEKKLIGKLSKMHKSKGRPKKSSY